MRGLRASLVALGVLIGGAGACAQEEYPAALWQAQHPSLVQTQQPNSLADAIAPLPPGSCRQAHAQTYPARLVAMSSQATSAGDMVFVPDLYSEFVTLCGTCHGPSADPPGLGSFRVASPAEFSAQMTPAILAHVTSDVSTNMPGAALDPMPPYGSGGAAFSSRRSNDPVVVWAKLVEAWLAAGKPQSFSPSSASDAGAAESGVVSPFALTVSTGDAMTNLGSCVPDKDLVAHADRIQKAIDLDTLFARAKSDLGDGGASVPGEQVVGLPLTLDQTDLFTFDTKVLAEHRVIAFQPAYPLWSDDAGKLRMVRVPLGKSIKFDKTTQEFEIPDNTRFYKTFMRRVVDTDGSIRWRKIETRLIVARQDTQRPDGTAQNNALFGTYLWNESETTATLHIDPLNDGRPFSDKLLTVTVDEPLAADLLSQGPSDPEYALVTAGAARHYAIPSSDRCVQCHEGSPSKSFVLGFRPIQVKRRVSGEGGTLVEPLHAPATSDELSQLERLIDYGVVTGISSPDDVLPLERSQGTRTARTPQELVAQGYLMANCAHCHNPRGLPSVANPELANVLNLLPGPNGGVFEFPLDTFSPRITRGEGGTVQIPYITPSLLDLTESPNWWIGGSGTVYAAYAPWRSLIYRNVDTPFTYAKDFALFPHMPMDTAGYDCRARQLLADWMVSIPSLLKRPDLPEYGFPGPGVTSNVDDSPQPYVEVKPGDVRYDDAVRAAQLRLQILHTGTNPSLNPNLAPTEPYSRYYDCPNTSDILDPDVTRDPRCHPVPAQPSNFQSHNGLSNVYLASLGVPTRAHWINTDLTQPLAPWNPRRIDWAEVLVNEDFSSVMGAQSCPGQMGADPATFERTVSVLQTASLDSVRDFVTHDFPLGLWNEKPGCNFPSSVRTAGSYAGSARPQWMDNPASQTQDGSHVYAEPPGATVYKLICINCHGTQYDGHGRLSDNLLLMTGGVARVADFKDGLFGPVASPGQNMLAAANGFAAFPADVDAGASWASTTPDDRAARYMSWMGLGGTDVNIPQPILQIVANTKVLGVTPRIPSSQISANMLSVAKIMCEAALIGTPSENLGNHLNVPTWFQPDPNTGGVFLRYASSLVTSNGQAELFLHLCTAGNPPPLMTVRGDGTVNIPGGFYPQQDSAGNPLYVSGQFGDERSVGSGSQGVTSTNLRPWCLRKSEAHVLGPGEYSTGAPTAGWPLCPDSIDDGTNPPGQSGGCATYANNHCWGVDDLERWTARGAINAGFAVYLYMQGIERGSVSALPGYDHCELLH